MHDPRSGDDEGGRREHAAANAASEAGTTQLTQREHTNAHTSRQAVAELSPRCVLPLDQRAQKALVLAERSPTRAHVLLAPRERFLASGVARQAGFPERFIEVMTACWDSGTSRSRRHLAFVCEATQPLLSTQSGQPRPHHTWTRAVGAQQAACHVSRASVSRRIGLSIAADPAQRPSMAEVRDALHEMYSAEVRRSRTGRAIFSAGWISVKASLRCNASTSAPECHPVVSVRQSPRSKPTTET